jgi:hypothetical protein
MSWPSTLDQVTMVEVFHTYRLFIKNYNYNYIGLLFLGIFSQFRRFLSFSFNTASSNDARIKPTIVEVLRASNHYTANEGPVRIQYKCLVPIYVFQEMKLQSLGISKTEL